ncbi:MAG: hypothetical protein WKF84_28140 [Pyrinomonadaceae bacterium]
MLKIFRPRLGRFTRDVRQLLLNRNLLRALHQALFMTLPSRISTVASSSWIGLRGKVVMIVNVASRCGCTAAV